MLISRCCFAEGGTDFIRACRTCSTIVFPHSTNQILHLWRCRCRSVVVAKTPKYHGALTSPPVKQWRMRAKTNSRKIVTIAQIFIFSWRFIYRSRFGCLSFPLKNLKTAFLWDDLGQDQLSRFIALQRNRQIRSGKRFIGSFWCNMIRAIDIVDPDGDHPEGTRTKATFTRRRL